MPGRVLPSIGALVLGAMALVGCGPIEYMNQVSFKAGAAVRAAREAHAEQRAPYEMAAAEEYLTKAREEAARSEYESAIDLGRKAEDFAIKAKAITLGKNAAAPAAGASPQRTAAPAAEKRATGHAAPAAQHDAPASRGGAAKGGKQP